MSQSRPNRPTHLRLVVSNNNPIRKTLPQIWAARFARAAGEILRAPATKLALFGTAAIMTTTYAATGNVQDSLTTGMLSGLGVIGIGRNLQTATVGGALAATCLFGAVTAENWVDQQRKAANPLPAMMANNDLGPRTIVSDVPLTRNQVDVTTIIGKLDRLDPTISGGAPLECTRYWVIRHQNLPREQSDIPELRQFDLKQPDTAQHGDCAAIDAWRNREMERAYNITRSIPSLSTAP